MKSAFRLAAVVLAVTVPHTALSAQEDVLVAPEGSQSSIDLAREIIALGMPESRREAIFFATMDQMMAQMIEAQNKATPIDDPQVKAIIDRHIEEFKGEAQRILSARIPDMMDAWALAYANMFSQQELRDIRDFVATPSGQAFFELSPAIAAEPNFASANQRYMDEVISLVPGMQARLRDELVDYLASQIDEPNAS